MTGTLTGGRTVLLWCGHPHTITPAENGRKVATLLPCHICLGRTRSPRRVPVTGAVMDAPYPVPRRVFALWDADQPCEHQAIAYTGTVPCTGAIRCSLCGTEWDPASGQVVFVYEPAGRPL